jgi:hypothetical protein
MEKIDFWKKQRDLRDEIISEINRVVKENNGMVNVQYCDDYYSSESNNNTSFDYVDWNDMFYTGTLIYVNEGSVYADCDGLKGFVSFDDITLVGLIRIYDAITK